MLLMVLINRINWRVLVVVALGGLSWTFSFQLWFCWDEHGQCLHWWIPLVSLNLCLDTSGANGEQRQGAARPQATHPPVRAIIGNTELRSFNFILSTARAALHNVIISSRSAGPSDRALLSRHWGNANWFHISGGIFKAPTCYIDCHFRERYENQRKMSNRAHATLNPPCCLLWSLPPGTRYFLMPHCQRTVEEVCMMLLTCTLVFSTAPTGICRTTAAKQMLRRGWL